MSNPTTVPCRICCRAINAKAKKCFECNSYQDKVAGRILNLGIPMTALLVAFSSLLFQWTPIVWDWLHQDADRLNVRILSLEQVDNRMVLFVSNTGSRAAAIRSASILVPTDLIPVMTTPTIVLEIPQGRRLIEPGESAELVLTSELKELPRTPRPSDDPGSFELTVEVVRFSGQTITLRRTFIAVP